MRDIEKRLAELESRVAHHEQMAEALSDVLARQDGTIDLLTARIKRLIERLQVLESTIHRPPDNQPPPHY
jgi:SlyX protein